MVVRQECFWHSVPGYFHLKILLKSYMLDNVRFILLKGKDFPSAWEYLITYMSLYSI